jgi:hypothetical protein
MVMLKAAPIMSQRDMEFVTAWTILVVTLVTSVFQGSLGILPMLQPAVLTPLDLVFKAVIPQGFVHVYQSLHQTAKNAMDVTWMLGLPSELSKTVSVRY